MSSAMRERSRTAGRPRWWIGGSLVALAAVLGLTAMHWNEAVGSDDAEEGIALAVAQPAVGAVQELQVETAEPIAGSIPATPASPTATCNQNIYANTIDSGYFYGPGAGFEALDFGTSAGGTVCSFKFGYYTAQANPGTITIRFYSGTTSSSCPGTFLAGWNLSGLPGSGGYILTFNIPAGQEFTLPPGAFGYSYQMTVADTGPLICSGGSGQQDLFWKNCALQWFGGSPWAGFYMDLYAEDPAVQDIRVEPTSLNFDCTGASAPAIGVEALPPPADKLLDEENLIAAAFAAGQGKVDVIVNLAPPRQLMANTDFQDAQSLAALQQEVAQRQDAVLDTLLAGDFDLGYRYDNIAAFSGQISQKALDQLLADPRVESVNPVRMFEAHLAQGIPLMNAAVARATHNGAGMSVAICDTGVDYTHPRLGGGGFPNAKVIGGYDFGDGDANPMDCQGHGTCCAGLAGGNLGTVGDYIGGVGYNAKIYALKMVPGCTGSASEAAMIASWDWCVTHKNDDPANPIMVISTSFGGGRYYSTCDGTSPGMTTAANNANAAGITVLASSGNDGYCDSMGWPACISSVISVGAVYDANFGTYTPCVNAGSCATKIPTGGCPTGYYVSDPTAPDKVTAYSNSASFLDIFAPSNAAYTADIVGAGGYNAAGDYTPSFGGTSAACPYAAGAVACLQEAAKTLTGSYLTPAQVRSKLAATGDNKTDSKVAITKPRVNLGNAVASLTPCPGQFLTIHNDGGQTLNVTSITKPSWITLDPAPPYAIPAYSSLTICVTQNCGACAGSNLNGNLAINSDDPDEPVVNVSVQATCPILVTPPVVSQAISRKTHPGVYDVSVLLATATEGRAGGPTTVIVTFDKTIQRNTGTNADVLLTSGSVSSLAAVGSQLTIQMAGALDDTKLRITFPGIAASGSPLAIVTDDVCFGVALGDVNGDSTVNVLDLVSIRNNLNQATNGVNFRADVNTDSTISVLDLVVVRNNLNNAVVGVCP